MFSRQWFAPSSQYGLMSIALEFEQHLLSKSLESARKILVSSYWACPSYWERQFFRLKNITHAIHSYSLDPLTPLKVSFDGFWPNMNPMNCQLLDLLKSALPERTILVVPPNSASDIYLYSCYGGLPGGCYARQTGIAVLFLAENVRPIYSSFDLSFTSDIDAYGGRNIYLPLWLLELDWFNKQYHDRKPISIESVTSHLFVETYRNPSVLYVGNNEVPRRSSIINGLKQLGVTVEVYGSQTNPIENKIELSRNFHMVFCEENSISAGYVTEKFIHGYLSHAFFAYSGGWKESGIIPPPTMIDTTNLPSHSTTKLLPARVQLRPTFPITTAIVLRRICEPVFLFASIIICFFGQPCFYALNQKMHACFI